MVCVHSWVLVVDYVTKQDCVCWYRDSSVCFYPARACASKGLCDRSWCPYIIYCLDFFWNQSFISKNTHFEMSILTQIGFSSNLMASGTVQQLDKSSWSLQIPIVCRLGKGSPMPETHIAPNHTPTIADFVPKWLNTPTLLYYWDLASLQLMQPRVNAASTAFGYY